MPQQAPSRGNPIQDYVTVAERIEAFYRRFPEGRIITHIIEHDAERGFILMRAEGFRNSEDAMPAATGHAFELRSEGYVNRTSYIENCESSSVGRMLAMMGFEVKRGIASREEIEKSTRMASKEVGASMSRPRSKGSAIETHKDEIQPSSEEQKEEILNLLEALRPSDRKAQRDLLVSLTGKQSRDDLTEKEALELIESLKKQGGQGSIQDDPVI